MGKLDRVPVALMAYDLLEQDGEDVRKRPLSDRRAALEAADAELMRRIAALVEPRHRGKWEPWPQD